MWVRYVPGLSTRDSPTERSCARVTRGLTRLRAHVWSSWSAPGVSSWGQFLWPLLVTSDPAVRPLPLEIGFYSAQQPVDWGQVFAFGTLLVLPVVIVFLTFQRHFAQSVARSAIKE
jgi:hypothetical protein